MAKRSTVGGPKQRRATGEHREVHLSRAERERITQQRILIGVGIVAIISVLIVIAALINDEVVLPRQQISNVNGEEISVQLFEDRVQYERFQLAEQIRALYQSARANGFSAEEAESSVQQFAGQQLNLLANPRGLADQVLVQMEREVVLRQQAESLGVEVDGAAVDEQVADFLVLFTGRSLTQTPSATPSLEPTLTLTPLVSPTSTSQPSETPLPTETLQPTAQGCEEGEDCPTVTPAATQIPSATATETPAESATPTETPTETPTLEEGEVRATVENFRENYYEGADDVAGFDEEAVRDIFYNQALAAAVRDHLTSDREAFPDTYVHPEDIWVNARHVLIAFPEGEPAPAEDDTDNPYYEEALAVAEALRNGEPFAPLAQAVSDDSGSGAQGGSLGWSSSTGYVEGFREAVEEAALGEIVGPVRSQFGYHVIQVLDREIRDFGAQQLEGLREEAFNTWLDEQVISVPIQRRSNWEDLIPDDPTLADLLGDVLPSLREG